VAEFERREFVGETDRREAYCSWCGVKSVHESRKKKFGRRLRYQCSNCGQLTAKCVACDAMAQVPGVTTAHKFCVVHNGGAGSFESLYATIDCPSEFVALMMRRDGANIVRGLKTARYVVGGLLTFGSGAWVAAPVFGGLLGSAVLGLNGAAATSAGLAMIGGGSIAAGGLGMAGGVAVISTIGGLGGASLSGLLSNKYLSDVKNFGITQIRDGRDPALVFIDGFLTEKTATSERWLEGLADSYSGHKAYHVTWESKRLKNIGTWGGPFISRKALIKATVTGALKASRRAAYKTAPLSIGMDLAAVAGNPWFVALSKAQKTGELLKDALMRSIGRSFILMGHSLGARVAFHTLSALGSIPSDMRHCRIDSAHLLGGAVGIEPADGWNLAAGCVENSIRSYHSDNDGVLKWAYGAGQLAFRSPAIGRTPIPLNETTLENIVNIDVTDRVGGHTQYHESLSSILDTSS